MVPASVNSFTGSSSVHKRRDGLIHNPGLQSGGYSTSSLPSHLPLPSSSNSGYRYYSQEKAYLKKIQHDTSNDYAERPLGSAISQLEYDSDSDDDSDLLPREAMGLGGVGTSFDDEYTDNVTSYPFLEASYNHEEMENDESLPERLEWQAMLASVLTGEVVRSEKRRLKTTTDATIKEDDLWLEIRARMCGRTFDEQKRIVEDARANLNPALQEIAAFKVSNAGDLNLTLKEVKGVLAKLETCEQLWQTTRHVKANSSLYSDPGFQRHVEALITWANVNESILLEFHILELLTGNENLDPTIAPDSSRPNAMLEATSLVERILKQENLLEVFEQKMNISPVIEKAREAHIQYFDEFSKIGLPVNVEGLEKLMKFAPKLIEEIISLRLAYITRMTNPTMMLIDQMIEDLSLYMKVALLVQQRNSTYTFPVPDLNWLTYKPGSQFEKAILRCVEYFFELSQSKFVDISPEQTHRRFKEIDGFESQYEFLEQVGRLVDGGEVVVAIQSCSLVMKMNSRLLNYWEYQKKGPLVFNTVEVERWYTHLTERIRKAQGNLLRFYRYVDNPFANF